MKPLFDLALIPNLKNTDKKPLQCYECSKSFMMTVKQIKCALNTKHIYTGKYCSKTCTYSARNIQINVQCNQCSKSFMKQAHQCKKSPNHFCSRSCSVTYNNTHKTKGIRRSKLEIWLESKLSELYPTMDIHFNRKDAINSELDIYIPELKLAFELNGLFHYEPIFGQDKLDKIQNNDNRKFQACLERGIELCIIDSSHLKHFKEYKAKKYLDVILRIINNKLTY